MCPKCFYTNHFGRDCVYYDAYECFACHERSFFDDMAASPENIKDLELGKVETIVGSMCVELEQ